MTDRKMPQMSKSLTETDWEVLVAFAECDMRPYRTADKLYMSKGSIPYHLKRIQNETGLNPYKFYDLIKLLGFRKDNNALSKELKQAKILLDQICYKYCKCIDVESESE